tara:strand:- start:254 stop:430 length:177 start_codon:yes stop_codon:yes gene_type:complete
VVPDQISFFKSYKKVFLYTDKGVPDLSLYALFFTFISVKYFAGFQNNLEKILQKKFYE